MVKAYRAEQPFHLISGAVVCHAGTWLNDKARVALHPESIIIATDWMYFFSLDMSCVHAGGKYMRKYNMAEEDEWVCKYSRGTHLHNNKKLSIKYKELPHTCVKAHKTISYVCQTWFLQKNSIIYTLKSLKWQLIPLPLVFSTRMVYFGGPHGHINGCKFIWQPILAIYRLLLLIF